MKKVFYGYLRTEESTDRKLTAVFIYKRRCKKWGVINKVRVTIENLTTPHKRRQTKCTNLEYGVDNKCSQIKCAWKKKGIYKKIGCPYEE